MSSEAMTVCFNGTCPFEDCSHHPGQLKGMPRDDTVTVMSLDAVCRRYIGWLVDKLAGTEWRSH
nr:MAG TPA: hypothetical protein [Caudoviricetes sp.]